MPMNAPPVADERQGLLAFLAQQRSDVRIAAYGLTDDQARMATTASSLSIGGLVKHVTVGRAGLDRQNPRVRHVGPDRLRRLPGRFRHGPR